MLGALCHDLGKPPTTAFIDGRIRSIDHEQAGVAPTRALLDRLNVHTHRRLRRPRPGPGHRRASSEAADVLQVADAGRRRRVPPPRAEGRPGAARARGGVRLPRPDRPLRLQRHGLVPRRAREGPRRRARARRAARAGAAHLLAWACGPGRRWERCCARSTSISSMAGSDRWRTGSRSPDPCAIAATRARLDGDDDGRGADETDASGAWCWD